MTLPHRRDDAAPPPRPSPQGRVCVVVSRFPVASETFVLRQIVGLIDRGWDVSILPVKHLTNEPIPSEFSRYPLLEQTRASTTREPESRGARVGELLRLFVRSLCRRPVRTLEVARRWGRRDVTRILRLADVIRDTEPFDVFHCHFGPVGAMLEEARWLTRSGAAITTVFHGYDLSRDDVDPTQYRRLFTVAAALLPVSEAWAERLRQLGAPANKISVHRMGVVFNDDVRVGQRGGDEIRLISVCRLVEKKGIADAIDAVAERHAAGDRLRYEILGDGPLMDSLKARAEEAGVASIVTFHGWTDPADARKLLLNSDILIAPSVTASDGDQEGIPLAIMEGMAAELPVISTNHSGIPELVRHERDGFLAAERSPKELADAIERLASDADLRRAMGSSAAERVRTLHDQNELDDRLSALLADAIAEGV